MKGSTKLILTIVGVIFAGFVVGVVSILGYVNKVRNDGIAKEVALSTMYESEQNELTTMVTSLMEMGSLANYKTQKMQDILTDAVQGRYGEKGFSAQGAFFAAVSESYPDLTSNLDVWDTMMTEVSAKRNAYKDKQNLRIDMARNYSTWLDQGIFQHVVIQWIGFPSDRLKVNQGDNTLVGTLALVELTKTIKSDETNETYSTGKTKALDYTGRN